MTMTEEQLFSIGNAANLCGVSSKALRYYESLELIQPKLVSKENGYRYYDKETLLLIPIIKYYQQVGLDLKHVKKLISLTVCNNHYHFLTASREEIKAKRDELLISLASVDDWLQLIIEGEMCLQNQNQLQAGLPSQVVSLKYYCEEKSYCQLEQLYRYNYKESIINLEWTKYLKNKQLEVSGPVILKYDSYQEKMTGQARSLTILQHCFPESPEFSSFGGFMALSCYHIGPLEKIEETYQKIVDYAELCQYTLKSECYERHVIDYWVTKNDEEFVTEIIIPTATDDK